MRGSARDEATWVGHGVGAWVQPAGKRLGGGQLSWSGQPGHGDARGRSRLGQRRRRLANEMWPWRLGLSLWSEPRLVTLRNWRYHCQRRTGDFFEELESGGGRREERAAIFSLYTTCITTIQSGKKKFCPVDEWGTGSQAQGKKARESDCDLLAHLNVRVCVPDTTRSMSCLAHGRGRGVELVNALRMHGFLAHGSTSISSAVCAPPQHQQVAAPDPTAALWGDGSWTRGHVPGAYPDPSEVWIGSKEKQGDPPSCPGRVRIQGHALPPTHIPLTAAFPRLNECLGSEQRSGAHAQ